MRNGRAPPGRWPAGRIRWPTSSSLTPPGIDSTRPREAEIAYDVRLRLTPSSKGPSVSAAQYTSTRCASGRRLRTRQIALSVRSIVNTSANAATSSTTSPTVPTWLALAANCVSAASTGLAMPSGTRLCSKYRSSACWKRANIGNAVNSASITVTSGTRPTIVVKVRLPAVRPRRSSAKRWRIVCQVSAHGHVRSVCHSALKWAGQVAGA